MLILPPTFPWEISIFEEQLLAFLLKFQHSKRPEGKEKVSLKTPLHSLVLPRRQGVIIKLSVVLQQLRLIVGKPAWLQNTGLA